MNELRISESHIKTRIFGITMSGEPVVAAELENANIKATVLNYGATLQSLLVQDQSGRFIDVVLGYDTIGEYEKQDGNLGATIGRFANRIREGSFTLNGQQHQLSINDAPNHLHGGFCGFDRKLWELSVEGNSAVFTLHSPDGEEGYPGNLMAKVSYTLSADALTIHYEATTDRDTIVNLTNHSYFNLNGLAEPESDALGHCSNEEGLGCIDAQNSIGDALGHCSNEEGLGCKDAQNSIGDALGHHLVINADTILENDSNCLPTGRLIDVTGTVFDFRHGKTIGQDINSDCDLLTACGGYDHDYLFIQPGGALGALREAANQTPTVPDINSGDALREAAVLTGDISGISMRVLTDKPGMQLYSANFLSERHGKNGSIMKSRSAVCLETMGWSDSINHPDWPQSILRAGEKYDSITSFQFSN